MERADILDPDDTEVPALLDDHGGVLTQAHRVGAEELVQGHVGSAVRGRSGGPTKGAGGSAAPGAARVAIW